MPHQIKLIGDLDVAVVTFSGRIALDEFQQMLDELPEMPGFHRHLKLIADFRGCETSITGPEMQKLATYARKTDAAWGETKWALLAPDDVIFGLSRMYMALTADYEVDSHVFRSAADADDWLELGVGIDEALRQAA